MADLGHGGAARPTLDEAATRQVRWVDVTSRSTARRRIPVIMAESEPPGGPEHAALAPPPPTGETPPLDDSLFFQLFDLSPLPTVVTRLSDHTVLAVNKSTSDVFQVSQEAALGRKAHDYYVHPEERLNLATVVEREGRADNVRLEARRPDGSTFWLSVSARRVAFDGEPAMLSVFTDVTEALAAQRALEASKRRLAAQSRALM
jgi:PAS domain S-box-containing protein